MIGKRIHLQLSNTPTGKYTVQVVGSSGQIIYSSNIQVNVNTRLHNIELNKNTAAGKYELLMTGNNYLKLQTAVYI